MDGPHLFNALTQPQNNKAGITTMRRYKPTEIENMVVDNKRKTKISEQVDGRDDGTIVYKKQGDAVAVYYRYRSNGSDKTIFICRYGRNQGGYTLSEIREIGRGYARTKREVAPVGLKEHLEQVELEKERAREALRLEQEAENRLGSLEDLCRAYVGSLFRKEAASARDVERCLERNLIKPFSQLCLRKANTITTDDLMPVFRSVLDRGVTREYNMFRGNLGAAYNFCLKADYDPRHLLENGKKFRLQYNPVAAIPKYTEFERVLERTLNNDEIYRFWHCLGENYTGSDPIYGLLARFCLACFGNRPEQLNDVRWTDIDRNLNTLRFVDSKGKNAKPKKRIIVLTQQACDILDQVAERTGNYEWPFTIKGKQPIRVDSLGHYIADYNDWLHQQALEQDQEPPERFTMRDFRRTATRMFTDCRVPKEQRYLLQSRQDGSIESKHYDHDDRLAEKRDVAKIYEDYLDRIISNSDSTT